MKITPETETAALQSYFPTRVLRPLNRWSAQSKKSQLL